MKASEQKEMGTVKTVTRSQTVFYKLLPSGDNKQKVADVVGDENWDMYIQRFKEPVPNIDNSIST